MGAREQHADILRSDDRQQHPDQRRQGADDRREARASPDMAWILSRMRLRARKTSDSLARGLRQISAGGLLDGQHDSERISIPPSARALACPRQRLFEGQAEPLAFHQDAKFRPQGDRTFPGR